MMDWLRDRIRKWLILLPTEAMVWRHHSDIAKLQKLVTDLRSELNALKGEVRARTPQPQQVTLRIQPDFERSQVDALEEFREKGKD